MPKSAVRTFDAKLENLHPMISWISDHLQGIAEKDVRRIQLACEEAIVNSIEHGKAHLLEIRVKVLKTRLEILFKDQGTAFNPLDFTPPLDGKEPGGLGIHFIKTCVDSVKYQRVGQYNLLSLIHFFQNK